MFIVLHTMSFCVKCTNIIVFWSFLLWNLLWNTWWFSSFKSDVNLSILSNFLWIKMEKKIKCVVNWIFLNEIKLSQYSSNWQFDNKNWKTPKGTSQIQLYCSWLHSLQQKRPTKCLWFVKQIVVPQKRRLSATHL